jgi:hypothetical protein
VPNAALLVSHSFADPGAAGEPEQAFGDFSAYRFFFDDDETETGHGACSVCASTCRGEYELDWERTSNTCDWLLLGWRMAVLRMHPAKSKSSCLVVLPIDKRQTTTAKDSG